MKQNNEKLFILKEDSTMDMEHKSKATVNLDSTALLMKDIGKYPMLTEEETNSLLIKAREGDKDARETLINSNLKLAASAASNYLNKGLDITALVSEGAIGINHAIDKYDFEKGTKFSSFAYQWITHYMGKAVQNEGRAIKIPNHLQEDFAKVLRAKSDYYQDHGKDGDFDDIAEMLGGKFTADYVNELTSIYHSTNVDSLDRDVYEDTSMYELVADNSSYDSCDYNYDAATEMLDSLDERSAFVLKSLFGCDGSKKLTIQAIANKLDLTIEDVENIKAKAFKTIQNNFDNPFEVVNE